MLTTRANFGLVSFGEEPVSPSLYGEAERVYLDSIGATAKTNTNEIAYWRDRYNKQYGKLGDRLYVFGLLDEDKTAIGFALVFYFKKHNLVVVDHIAIKEPARHFGAFFYFKQLIAEYLSDQGLQIDYVIVEIVTAKESDPHPIDAQLLIGLLKQRNFKIVKMRYYTPSIKEGAYDRRIDTTLMLMRNDKGNRIASSELISLIECLLNDLYLRWYSPHSNDLKAFQTQLRSLMEVYRHELASSEYIELNGAPLSETTIPLLPKKQKIIQSAEGIYKPTLLLLLIVGISGSLAAISYFFRITIPSILGLFVVSLFACLSLLAVWHKDASKQAERVGRLVLTFIRNQKNVR